MLIGYHTSNEALDSKYILFKPRNTYGEDHPMYYMIQMATK